MQKFLIILFFSILSGMPISIFITIISALLTEGGIDIAIITTFSITRMPYSLKIFFAPFLDNINLKILHFKKNKRQAWMFISGLFAGIFSIYISQITILENLSMFKLLCVMIAFFATIYDISWDALKIEILSKEEMSYGVNIANIGYTIGKTITGVGSLYLAVYTNWNSVFFAIGLSLMILSIASLLMHEIMPNINQNKLENLNNFEIINQNTKNNSEATIENTQALDIKVDPKMNKNTTHETIFSKSKVIFAYTKNSLIELLARKHIVLILISILFYKTCDSMLSAVTINFYLKSGFTKEQIAVVIKIYAAISALIGSTFGAYICRRYGIFLGLMICGLAEGLTNCLYIIINHYPTYNVFVINVIIENFTGGMGSVALMTYISSIINVKFTAMQYGIFSSVVSIANITLSQYAGSILNYMQWDNYCIFTALLCLPSLFVIYYLNKKKIYNI